MAVDGGCVPSVASPSCSSVDAITKIEAKSEKIMFCKMKDRKPKELLCQPLIQNDASSRSFPSDFDSLRDLAPLDLIPLHRQESPHSQTNNFYHYVQKQFIIVYPPLDARCFVQWSLDRIPQSKDIVRRRRNGTTSGLLDKQNERF